MTSVRKMVLVPVEKYKDLQTSNNCSSVEKVDSSTQTTHSPTQTQVTPDLIADKSQQLTLPQTETPPEIGIKRELYKFIDKAPTRKRVRRQTPALKWITL